LVEFDCDGSDGVIFVVTMGGFDEIDGNVGDDNSGD